MVVVSESRGCAGDVAVLVWRLVGGAGGSAVEVAIAYLCTR